MLLCYGEVHGNSCHFYRLEVILVCHPQIWVRCQHSACLGVGERAPRECAVSFWFSRRVLALRCAGNICSEEAQSSYTARKKKSFKKSINADYYLAVISCLNGAVQSTGTRRLLSKALQCRFWLPYLYKQQQYKVPLFKQSKQPWGSCFKLTRNLGSRETIDFKILQLHDNHHPSDEQDSEQGWAYHRVSPNACM